VLVLDALGQLTPHFASCRLLPTLYAPYHVQNDWTGLQIGVCIGPWGGWTALWPHLKHYGWRTFLSGGRPDRRWVSQAAAGGARAHR
jgi:hypothetical protein